MPGGLSRWNATKDLSWEPLRVERVVEVRYEHVLSGRFRHTARFVRWRRRQDARSSAPTTSSRRSPRRALRHLRPRGLTMSFGVHRDGAATT